MKRIEAFIQVQKLEAVQAALSKEGIQGLSVESIRGYGRQMGQTNSASNKGPVLLPKTKIEIVVPDSKADIAIQAIVDAAKSGEIGDGKIFVSNVEQAIRIRTGETGDSALE